MQYFKMEIDVSRRKAMSTLRTPWLSDDQKADLIGQGGGACVYVLACHSTTKGRWPQMKFVDHALV